MFNKIEKLRHDVRRSTFIQRMNALADTLAARGAVDQASQALKKALSD